VEKLAAFLHRQQNPGGCWVIALTNSGLAGERNGSSKTVEAACRRAIQALATMLTFHALSLYRVEADGKQATLVGWNRGGNVSNARERI